MLEEERAVRNGCLGDCAFSECVSIEQLRNWLCRRKLIVSAGLFLLLATCAKRGKCAKLPGDEKKYYISANLKDKNTAMA